MDKFTFVKKFLILESHLRSKFPEFGEKTFSEFLSFLKERTSFPPQVLLELSQIWQIRNKAFGKSLELPQISDEVFFLFKKLGKYFGIKI
jgi:hypothetical protein